MAPRGGRKRPTIFDVASLAEVSIATVSRVLNGHPVADDALVLRVRAAVSELGYRPNTVAQDFAHGVTRTVGVLVPDLANPFFPAILKGLAVDVTAESHRLLVVDSQEDSNAELSLVDELSRRCDGVVLCSPRMPADDLRSAAAMEVPLVCINRAVDGVGMVCMDFSAGMAQAIAHLAELGHRHVGYLAGPEMSWSEGRKRDGLQTAARELGITASVVPTGSSSDAGHREVPGLVAQGVTAVVAFNDLVALGALSRLREMEIEVPTDMSLIGFDDILVASFLDPPLTTISVPGLQLGRRAWAMLRRQLLEDIVVVDETLPSSLIVRRSTAAPRSSANG